MLTKSQIDKIFADKIFTTDWTGRLFESWQPVLDALRGRPVNILEAGTWEGRTALYLLNELPQSNITCIDAFTFGSEPNFDANLAAYADRCTKIKSESIAAINSLIWTGKRFDLIYIDASHERDVTLIDGLLAWKTLKVGGFLIFDDYGMCEDHMDDAEMPATGIDVFLDLQRPHLRIVHHSYQVIVQKTSEWIHPTLRTTETDAIPFQRRQSKVAAPNSETIDMLHHSLTVLASLKDTGRHHPDFQAEATALIKKFG